MRSFLQATALVLTFAVVHPANAQTKAKPAPKPVSAAVPARVQHSKAPGRTPGHVKTGPSAATQTPTTRRMAITRTPVRAKLPSNLVFEGLPANALTVRSLVKRKALKKALKVTDMVLARQPRNTEVGMQRAKILYWLGKIDAAEKQATAVYRLDNYNTAALRLVGDIRLQRKDVRGAIRAYREAILRGDADYDLRLRVIDLYITIDRPYLAEAMLRPGMVLPDELAWRLAHALYRWEAQVFAAGARFSSANRSALWFRAQGSAAYTWSRSMTLQAGVYGERRAAERAGGLIFGQFFFGSGAISGDARLAFSPLPSDFLPTVDGWIEAAYNFGKFALGGWIRYASYQIAPQLSLGPYAQIQLGRLFIKPGYLFVLRGDIFEEPQVDHTIFLRVRYQMNVQTSAFAWLYVGQESVFGSRRSVAARDESALSLVVGAERWLGLRWGVRGMITAMKYFEMDATLVELLVALRARF